jgi:hypothetical protein
MHPTTANIQKRYEGFLQTACLWKDDIVFELSQFKIALKLSKINIQIDEKMRLGKYIERFVSFQLSQEKTIIIIAENIQIQQEKITLGELDCLLLSREKPFHLEIIYKFYIYDTSIGKNEIEHFIGPNRKDSLVDKLTKLKEKQLPLLHSKECKSYLKSIALRASEIKQQVYFKAQLFVPFKQRDLQLKTLNIACIAGFYIDTKELKQFKDCKFYIPTKKDWLVIPHQNVQWLNFELFKEQSSEYLERKFSPLCWMKSKNGELQKMFLVWW